MSGQAAPAKATVVTADIDSDEQATSHAADGGDGERAQFFEQFHIDDAEATGNMSKSRRYVREQRILMEDAARRRPLMWCGMLIAVVGLLVMIIGMIETSGAEYERHHGWQLTTCVIGHNYGQNDTKCIYFTVTPNLEGLDTQRLCAVPAAMAYEAWFFEPPACSHLNRADADDIHYWKELGTAQVECYVPVGESSRPISADECTASVSTHGPSSIVWRGWVDRFVYLVRRPREGAGAIEAVTRTRLSTGLGLLTASIVLLILGICCLCNRCVSSVTHAIASQPPRIGRYYQQRHAMEHKLY